MRAKLLQQYPMLNALGSAQLEELLSNAASVRFPGGTILFDENQVCQGFPLLVSGSIRVIKTSINGRELVLYRVEPGETCILSSSCLLGNARYYACGVAEQDIELVLISPSVFKNLIANAEPFRNYIFSLFSNRLTDMMQLVSAVAFQKLDQRLAALLISKPNPINITHQNLADELGSLREIVSRLLKNFADKGWIVLGREQINVTNPESLAELSKS